MDSPTTLQEARTFWIGSLGSTAITLPILVYLGYKYCSDKIYSQSTMLVYIPYLIGSFLFTLSFSLHHGYNLSHGEQLYVATGSLEGLAETGFWADITWLAVASVFMQFVGLTFVAWAPFSLIRRAKKFQVLRVSKRHIVCVTCGGLCLGGGLVFGFCLLGGKAEFRRFSCFPRVGGAGGSALGTLPLLIMGSLVAWFFHRAQVELKDVTRTLHVKRLQKKAADIRRYSILTILNSFIWVAPYTILTFVEHAKLLRHVPVELYQVCSWAYEYHAAGIFFIIRLHAKNLRKKRRGAKHASDLHTTFAPSEEAPPLVENLNDRGVSIHFLHWFVAEHGVHPKMTVSDVMEKIVKEVTAEQKCAFVEQIKQLEDTEGRWAVGKKSYFVSHAWSDTFVKLLEQLTLFYRHTGNPDTVYFWIDIFAINQHECLGTELSLMHNVIEGSDAVLLTLSPWTAPLTLTRVWCLWEVLKALQMGTEIVPVMPSSEEVHFVRTLQHHRESILQMLSTIEVQNAGATKEEDRSRIFQEIAETIGFDGMNELLKVSLHQYLQGIAVDRAVVGLSVRLDSPVKDECVGTTSSRSSDSV